MAFHWHNNPDSKVHGINMGPNCGRQDPGGPHIGPMNLAIWESISGIYSTILSSRNESKEKDYLNLKKFNE